MNSLINLTIASVSTSSTLDDIAHERNRQIAVEGWDAKHDDKHSTGAMAMAAAAYAISAVRQGNGYPLASLQHNPIQPWPFEWANKWWKPKSQRQDLIRAAALLVAEIERIDRKAVKS
jgi:hypothetical protein